jgi:peptide-methionine (S)-S-oxide reductase
MRVRARRREAVIALATVAAGPFERLEAAFRDLAGVVDTAVGYAGGFRPNPSYELVLGGTTGHVEAVQVEYDPRRIFYAELLETFWHAHDPSALPLEPRHRSTIFAHSPEQLQVARLSLLAARAALRRPLFTEIRRATTFYRAEHEHQQVLERGLLLTPA